MEIKKYRAILGAAALAVGIMIVLGWSFAPSSVNSVSAAYQEDQGGASAEMLNYALNFKSASSLAVYGGNSVGDQGSEIRGVVGSAGEITGVANNALSIGDSTEAKRDLMDAFSAVDQLPCTNVSDANLGGQSFGPGVYCVGSATVAGRMTVDAGGDANARFVFRVNGTFTAEDASSIVREGGAQATNVYVFSRNSAWIGANATLGANVVSREDVTVGYGSTVSGKIIGVGGDVNTNSNIVATGTGFIEICKNLFPNDPIPAGTIFNFRVSGVQGTVAVPAGGCAPPLQVALGNVIITEVIQENTAVVGIAANPDNRLVSKSLGLQQAVVAVQDGSVTNETVVTFTNQTTRTGTIEICKFAALATINLPADPDVTGFFKYTVQGRYDRDTLVPDIFTVPVGFCSGPITTTILQGQGGVVPTPTPLAHPGVNFIVNSLADSNDGLCDAANCTLREAINASNANGVGADSITFSVSGTITLGATLPSVNGDLTIDGTAQDITISGNHLVQVMLINSPWTLHLNAVTIADGQAFMGGGIFNLGTVHITRSRFSGNSAAAGGGIFSYGTLSATYSTFSNNYASGSGGGIVNVDGTANVTYSTFSNNSSSGGGIYNQNGELTVTNSTFSHNNTGVGAGGGGGGIASVSGTATVINSTFNFNSSTVGAGGAISNSGVMTLINSTLSDNSATNGLPGGGIFTNTTAVTTLMNTIVADNIGGDCYINQSTGLLTADAFDLDSDGSCDNATTKSTTQINLGALANNGGPTQTMALMAPSAAIDRGDNIVCPPADQRGAARPFSATGIAIATCDIGAYEINTTFNSTFNTPSSFGALVTELARDNYRLEDVSTLPTSALVAPFTPDIKFDPGTRTFSQNTNGGVAIVALNAGTTPANQTTVRFFNRSLPGRIKVCKITADPVNIPVGTAFSFTIFGAGWTANPPGPPTPQALPFVPQQFTFEVLAGPASQGGFCAFAPGLWAVGQPVLVMENSISAANTTTLPLGLAATQAGLRLSSITATTPFSPTPVVGINFTVGTNPFIFGVPAVVGFAAINARNTTAEMTFTNFVYRPAILKLCKVAGAGVSVGTPFTFSIAPADPLTTWPYPTTPIPVRAGSCTFVDGPFPPNTAFDNIGLFNFGTSIVVTEIPAPGTTITAITSPTLTPVPNPNPPNFVGTLTPDIPNRRATLTLNQILFNGTAPNFNYYFNELSFTNTIDAGTIRTIKSRFDFDGDNASDIALFRPSDGNWYYNASGSGQVRAVHFGQAGDVPVAADYDGDGTTDVAVFRNGQWYVLGSTAGFSSASFGLATDIPQPGDFDGDGKADIAVFRPSDGTWYIMGSSAGFNAVKFGTAGDKAAAADFDGDGKMDPTVFRPSNGTWYILGSTAGFSGVQFGIAGDIPVQADYDGDNKADVAVYRSGTWYVMGSTTGFRATSFGTATDTPVPADYDGDGKTDVAVYRSSNTNWYILNSSQAGNAVGGFAAMQFGSAGDMLMRY